MTLREVQTALRCIAKRRSERNRFEAALHGVELGGNPDSGAVSSDGDRSKLTLEQEQAMRDQLQKIAMIKRREAAASRGR